MPKKHREAPEFALSDLSALTFRPMGSDARVSVADATDEQFHAHIQPFLVTKVRMREWPQEDRLALVNSWYPYFRDRYLIFPFAGCHHLEKLVDMS